MKVEQTAGRCKIVVFTDGTPLWPKLTIYDGERRSGAPEQHLSVADLYDLRYCIDRVLASLPPDAK